MLIEHSLSNKSADEKGLHAVLERKACQPDLSHKPGAGLQVNVNGAVKGTVKGDDFAKAFLTIWLGGEPPNPEIKAGMLGGACG